MFESIVTGHRTTTRRDLGPFAISWAVHALAIGAVASLALLFAADRLPAVSRETLTYVTVAAPPPPPPPPAAPAPPAPTPASPRPVPRPKPTPTPPAPVVAARDLPPPVAIAHEEEGAGVFERFDGVPGGVAGGVPEGVLGGIVGGLADVLPPPPPAPPPMPRAPVRAGGQIQAPALLKRVPPVYPPIAVEAQVEGVVILEATVGRDGRVEDVVVLRSVPLLDKAAIEAVRQWVYAPLLLNGQPERFVLTVTLSFSLT